MTNIQLTTSDAPIGYDTSESAQNLSVLCADCGADSDGSALFTGEEWGGYEYPTCSGCGTELRALKLIDPE